MLVVHACRFVGLPEFQNATSIPDDKASVAHEILRVTDDLGATASQLFIEKPQRVGVVTSFLMIYVLESFGHRHVSDPLKMTYVIHSWGVQAIESAVPISFQLDPLSIEYDIDLVAGFAVSFILQVVQ